MGKYNDGSKLYLAEFARNVDKFPMLHETISANSRTKEKLFPNTNIWAGDTPHLRYIYGKEILINENLEDDVVMFGKYYNIVNKES